MRPKLTLSLSKTDRIIEVLCWAVLVLLWGVSLSKFSSLPDTIPSHFDLSGKVDEYDSRRSIFILPFIGTVLFIGLTILNKYPHIFNYLTEITEENALEQYIFATRLLRWLKLLILIVFGIILFKILQIAGS